VVVDSPFPKRIQKQQKNFDTEAGLELVIVELVQ
jgi:hypothetical protein